MTPIDSTDFIKVSDHIEECILSLHADTLNPAKLFSLTIQSIEYIEKEYQTFDGTQKKNLLIESFKDLCLTQKHITLSKDIKEALLTFIEKDLDTVIDSIIQVSNGEFQINEKQQALLLRCAIQLCKCFFKHNQRSERP
jgi:transcription termination factor NusB